MIRIRAMWSIGHFAKDSNPRPRLSSSMKSMIASVTAWAGFTSIGLIAVR